MYYPEYNIIVQNLPYQRDNPQIEMRVTRRLLVAKFGQISVNKDEYNNKNITFEIYYTFFIALSIEFSVSVIW